MRVAGAITSTEFPAGETRTSPGVRSTEAIDAGASGGSSRGTGNSVPLGANLCHQRRQLCRGKVHHGNFHNRDGRPLHIDHLKDALHLLDDWRDVGDQKNPCGSQRRVAVPPCLESKG